MDDVGRDIASRARRASGIGVAARPIPLPQLFLAAAASAFLAVVYFKPLLTFVVGTWIARVPINLIVLCIALVGALSVDGRRTFGRRGNHLTFFLAVVGALAAASLFGGSGWGAIGNSAYVFGGSWIAYIVFYAVGRRDRVLQIVLGTLALCALANSAVGAWGAAAGRTLFSVTAQDVGSAAFGFDAETGRSGGVIGENYVGMFDVPALVFGIYWLSRPGWRRLLGVVAVGVSAIGIVVSFSRTSVASCALAALVALLGYGRRARFAGIALAIAIPVAAGVSALRMDAAQFDSLNPYARESMATRWSMEGFSGDVRLAVWESYLERALASPIIGKGPGFVAEQVALGSFVPHNSFMDVFVEFGAVGVALFLVPFAIGLRLAWRQRGRYDVFARLLVPIVFGIVVSLMTLSNPGARLLWACLGCLVGRLTMSSERPSEIAALKKSGRQDSLRRALTV